MGVWYVRVVGAGGIVGVETSESEWSGDIRG